MECVETKALKTGFWPEMAIVKSNPQVMSEDSWVGNGVSGGDDLFVDGLLDFSNEDVVDVAFVEDEEEEKDTLSASSSQEQNYNSCSGFSVKDEPLCVPHSDLAVPPDDLADLEWLSHFVEDSFSEFSLQHVTGNPPEKTQTPNPNRPEPGFGSLALRPIGFLTSVPAKARSKRMRSNSGRVWSLIGSLSSSETSSSSSSLSPSSSSSSSCLVNYDNGGQNLDFFRPPAKKQKKKPATEPQQRRCSHCGVQKTPQWRTGPKGAKTLCNACGVRYKSGRLLPEYRPACSPTFSSDVHSNNHRKVLEMRRKKETEYGPTPAVQSF